ncbi:hypothetical protein CGLO_12153 [Colletotrichum gloeosporioides Cg-14]|uniref:Uncharacterized protein n=1 Tax=Colletotrichum gloeosporioides (strain Cg-14) TaxID=1237896 RepID=T0LK74_COLGC|nr:hypothetical protein CGLO_12153 [Colletotrichum gloeosporioides Cg-14]
MAHIWAFVKLFDETNQIKGG